MTYIIFSAVALAIASLVFYFTIRLVYKSLNQVIETANNMVNVVNKVNESLDEENDYLRTVILNEEKIVGEKTRVIGSADDFKF